MSDIFLSYAREDVEDARRLAEVLATFGWEVWWDRTLVPGVPATLFQARALTGGASQLSKGESATFDFIQATERESVLLISGRVPYAPYLHSNPVRLTREGRWDVRFRLTWDGGFHDQELSFYWDGTHTPAPDDEQTA